MSLSARTISDRQPGKERWEPTPVKQWLWPIAAMTFILGLFIALALRSAAVGRPGGVPGVAEPAAFQRLSGAYWQMTQTITDLREQVAKLSDENNNLMTASTRHSETRDELNAARMAAGLTMVHGPGVIVTLNDSAKRPPAGIPAAMTTDLTLNDIIHDQDIQRVVNELRIAGAENIAVNDERIVASSAIRCVGPVIQVNDDPLAKPYHIYAIGDPNKLTSALDLPGGIREQLVDTDPAMISIAQAKDMTLPAFDGVTNYKFSHPVDVSADANVK